VLTLGLGIGMSVAVWSVIDAVLVEPLPYPEADRLVMIGETLPNLGATGYPMSALNYLDFAERNRSFESMAAVFRENLNVTGGSLPERLTGARVSASFFDVMKAPPRLGRGFRSEEDLPGNHLVAVISHGLWLRRFEGAEDAVGASLIINGQPHVVVGVAPEELDFPLASEIWLPIAIDPAHEDRGHGWVTPIGRIRSDVRISDAQEDLGAINQWIEREFPDAERDRIVVLEPLKQRLVGDVRPSLVVLMAAAVCVFFIATANTAILLVVRTATRQRELAVRQALGGSRWHLIRLITTEGLILSLFGGALGLAFAGWCTRSIELRFSALIPRSEGLGLDAGILGVAVLVSLSAGFLASLVPAIRSREDHIMTQLRESDRSATAGSSRIGRAMVVAEIALSVILLAGAALLIRTSVNLLRVDPGFDSDRAMTAEVALTDQRYSEESARRDFYLQALEELESIPGVEAVGSIYPLPLFGRRISTRAYVEGAPGPGPDAQRPLVEMRFVSPGYLAAAGLELVAGRFIDESDTAVSPPVVVVNESFVRQLVPHGNPVERRVTGWDPGDPEAEWDTIVGVVRNVRHVNLADDTGPEMYVPVTQNAFEWATFVVRARSDSAKSLANPMREAINRVDPELPVFHLQTMTEVVNRSLARTNIVTAVLALFAAVGLALAGIGVFSVVSHSVGQRVREAAVRMALGGTPREIVALMVRQGLFPVLLGILVGATSALVVTRVFTQRLYGVAPHDPLAFGSVAFLILAIATLAAWLPARRAAKVEPMTVLRAE
jgi:putative ABC transport system permease protein